MRLRWKWFSFIIPHICIDVCVYVMVEWLPIVYNIPSPPKYGIPLLLCNIYSKNEKIEKYLWMWHLVPQTICGLRGNDCESKYVWWTKVSFFLFNSQRYSFTLTWICVYVCVCVWTSNRLCIHCNCGNICVRMRFMSLKPKNPFFIFSNVKFDLISCISACKMDINRNLNECSLIIPMHWKRMRDKERNFSWFLS